MMENETQVSTVHMQCVLLFTFVWGYGCTLTAQSRLAFDEFIRPIIAGDSKEFPKAKLFKLSKNQIFPDRNTVFDWCYDKKNNGTWIAWIDVFPVENLNPKAKVSKNP